MWLTINVINLSYCCHIFPWLCIWGSCIVLFSCSLYVDPGKAGCCFHCYCAGYDIDGLVQERCNSSALAMELHLSCTNPSICTNHTVHHDPEVIFACWHIMLYHYHLYAELAECTDHTSYLSGVFCWVCLRHILTNTIYAIYGTVCYQLTNFSYDFENICT